MHLSAIVTSLFLAVATSATPAVRRAEGVCGSLLYSEPQCCSPDVLGLSALNCGTRQLKNHVWTSQNPATNAFTSGGFVLLGRLQDELRGQSRTMLFAP